MRALGLDCSICGRDHLFFRTLLAERLGQYFPRNFGTRNKKALAADSALTNRGDNCLRAIFIGNRGDSQRVVREPRSCCRSDRGNRSASEVANITAEGLQPLDKSFNSGCAGEDYPVEGIETRNRFGWRRETFRPRSFDSMKLDYVGAEPAKRSREIRSGRARPRDDDRSAEQRHLLGPLEMLAQARAVADHDHRRRSDSVARACVGKRPERCEYGALRRGGRPFDCAGWRVFGPPRFG